MSRPVAVVVGGVGVLPIAGMTHHYLNHVVGLRELGYDVHYVERVNRPGELYDPSTGEMTDDPAYALAYLAEVLPRFGVAADRFSFVDLENRCHGSGWAGLRDALDRADFLLTVATPTWFDELERCERRAYVDGDPMFTQVALETGTGTRATAAPHYPVLFSYGTRIGEPDCAIPSAGREWLPARPVVATSLWSPGEPPADAALTALLHWVAAADLTWNGRVYGQKDRELMRVVDVPRRVPQRRFVLAAGGGSRPTERLREAGWELQSALDASVTLAAYRSVVDGSFADLGVAKHAYVASRSGWFSDRSTCFLAAGRPVLHQETGFSDWLPAGDGVLSFSGLDDLVERIEELERDHRRHARAARAVAEEHFEARHVLAGMLAAAGFR